MTIREVYDKYKEWDKNMSGRLQDEGTSERVIHDLWLAVKQEVETSERRDFDGPIFPECHDAVILLAAAPELYEALERAVILLRATHDFIGTNPIQEYTVFYDEAECDGSCLATDCGIAEESARAALAKARGGEK